MRAFLGYTFRGREGLFSYLAYLGAALLGMFLLHMVILGAMLYDGYYDHIDLMLYEHYTPMIAAVFFGITVSRLMRIAVNGGTSRLSFILGTGAAAPVFALITAAAIQLVYTITELIYRAFGMEVYCFVTIDIWQCPNELMLRPRTMIMNISVMFCMLMISYSLALLFVGIKNRIKTPAAAIITGGVVFFYWLCQDGYIGLLRDIFERLHDYLDQAESMIAPERYGEFYIGEVPLTFSGFIGTFTAFGLVMFIILYAVYAALTFRVPVRGKE